MLRNGDVAELKPHQALGGVVSKSGRGGIMGRAAEHGRELIHLAHVADAIGGNGQKAIRLQHAIHLGDALRRILHMVEHVHCNDGVEGAVVKRKGGCLSFVASNRSERQCLTTFQGLPDHAGRQIRKCQIKLLRQHVRR
jgi:predicted methyltransferase MtxX (methanogen marker protein 4)